MPTDILAFVRVGFLAQVVDGALGVAFGIIRTSRLIAFGLPPVVAG